MERLKNNMPTDFDYADEKGRNASEEAARDFLWRYSEEIDKLHTGFLKETYDAYLNAAGTESDDEPQENPFQQAYEESQNEIRKRKK
jgi:hypothetical protein